MHVLKSLEKIIQMHFTEDKLFHTSLKSELTNTALSHFSPYTTVAYKEDYGYIIPCLKSECYEPLYSSKELTAFLEARRK